MMLIAALTTALVTNSGHSAWFVGVLVLMVYLIFATTLYLLPPRSAMKIPIREPQPPSAVLDEPGPERIAEVLFGLIMVLSFTGSLSVADAGRDDVRAMLIGALGCNIAWGIIDGILYLMDCLSEQGRGIRAIAGPAQGRGPGGRASRHRRNRCRRWWRPRLAPPSTRTARTETMQAPEPPSRPRLGKAEWLGGLGVFFWVFVTTFPVRRHPLHLHALRRARHALLERHRHRAAVYYRAHRVRAPLRNTTRG